MCSEACGEDGSVLSVSGQASLRSDGVIPSSAGGSKFFPSHNPSVGQNSGSFVAILICVMKRQTRAAISEAKQIWEKLDQRSQSHIQRPE